VECKAKNIKTIFVLFLILIGLQPRIAYSSEATIADEKVLFIIGLADSPDLRDYMALAIYPVVVKYKCYILFGEAQESYESVKLSPAQELFISKIKPDKIYVIGAELNSFLKRLEAISLKSTSETNLVIKIVKMFWHSSPAAVVVDYGNYTAAILGSFLASRLNIPLLYIENHDFDKVKSLLNNLKVNKIYCIVSNSTFIKILNEFTQVIDLSNKPLNEVYNLLGLKDSDYLVITNIRDRELEATRRFSILSPLLASLREGWLMVLHSPCTSFSEFRVKNVTLSFPSEVLKTNEFFMRIKKWTKVFNQTDIRLKSPFYPVNGAYIKGWLYFYGYDIRVYLGTSKKGAEYYDSMLLDLNNDGVFKDDEYFKIGDLIKVPVSDVCYSGRLGHDDPGFRYFELLGIRQSLGTWKDLYVHLKSRSWILGEIVLKGKRLKALCIEKFITIGIAPGAPNPSFGVIPILFIDLNEDGVFSHTERLHPGELNIHGLPAFLAQWSWIKPILVWPSGSYVKEKIQKFLNDMNASRIKYLVIVGTPTMIPPSNVPYKKQLFEEVAWHDIALHFINDGYYRDIAKSVGRIFASNIYDASLLIMNTIYYDKLVKIHELKAAVLNLIDRSGSYLEDREKVFEMFKHMEYDTVFINSSSEINNLSNATIIYSFGHSCPFVWAGLSHIPLFTRPVVIFAIGCQTLDWLSPIIQGKNLSEVLALRAIRNGAVAIIGTPSTLYVGSWERHSNKFFQYFGYNTTLGDLIHYAYELLKTENLILLGDPEIFAKRPTYKTAYFVEITILPDYLLRRISPEYRLEREGGIEILVSENKTIPPSIKDLIEQGETIIISVPSIIIAHRDGIRYRFIGWTGTASSNKTTITIYVNRSIALTANWKRQYLVEVFSTYGEVRGAGWYDEGDIAKISIEPAEIPILWFLIKRVVKNLRLEYRCDDGSWIDNIYKPFYEKSMGIIRGPATASFPVFSPMRIHVIWAEDNTGLIAFILLSVVVPIIAYVIKKSSLRIKRNTKLKYN